MLKKLFAIFFVLNIVLLPLVSFAQTQPTTSQAQAASTQMNKIMHEYNRTLVSELSRKLMENPMIGWKSGGLVKVIFSICFLIAFIQAVSQRPEVMVMDMAKLAFYTWLVIALLGGPTYTKFSFLNVSDPAYQSTSRSLDMDIFNFVAYQADTLADGMFAAGGPDALSQQMTRSNTMIKNMLNAKRVCSSASADARFCYSQFKSEEVVVDPKTVKTSPNSVPPAEKESSWIPGADAMAAIASTIQDIVALFSDLTFLAFYIITWIVDLVRAILTQFLLIAFGIITGVSFFLAKIFIPFAILPKYRGRVFQSLKIPLSAALYGFASSLIVFVSGACFEAMNGAAVSVIYNKIMNGNGGAELVWVVPNVILSMMAGMILVTILQLLAITKVPALCKDILNLSMDSIVGLASEIGQTISGAAMTIGAGVVTSGLTIGAGAAGSVMGRFIGGAKGLTNGLSQRMRFNAPFSSPKFNNFKGGGSSGGAGPSSSGSGGGGVGGVNLAGMDAARTGTSTATTATKLAEQEALYPKGVTPDPKGNVLSDEELKALNKATAANASDEDKEKAQDILKEKRDKDKERSSAGKAPNLMNAVMQAAIKGDASGFGAFFGAKAGAISESMTSASRNQFGMNATDDIFTGSSRAYANKRDQAQKAVSNFTRGAVNPSAKESVTEGLKSASSRKMSKEESSIVTSAVEQFNKTGAVSAEQKAELFDLRNSADIKNASERETVDQILNEEARQSIARIKSGKYTDADMKTVYRAQESDFRSEEFDKDLADMNSEAYTEYMENQAARRHKLMSTISSSGFNSNAGIKAADELRALRNDGMINRADYAPLISKEAQKVVPLIERTELQDSKQYLKEYNQSASQIEKLQKSLEKAEANHQKQVAKFPNSEITEDPKIEQLRQEIKQAFSNQKESYSNVAQYVKENKDNAMADTVMREFAEKEGLISNKRSQKDPAIEDALKNSPVNVQMENRVANKQHYNNSYSSTENVNVGNMTFTKGSDTFTKPQEDNEYRQQLFPQVTMDNTYQTMKDSELKAVQAALEERIELMKGFKDDHTIQSQAEFEKYGKIASEIEILKNILDKYKDS